MDNLRVKLLQYQARHDMCEDEVLLDFGMNQPGTNRPREIHRFRYKQIDPHRVEYVVASNIAPVSSQCSRVKGRQIRAINDQYPFLPSGVAAVTNIPRIIR